MLLSRIVICLLALVGARFAYYDIVQGPWDHDSGYFLMVSQIFANGRTPYRDFPVQYTPLMILLNAVPLALGLAPLLAAKLIPVVWILANVAVTFFLARRFSRDVNFSLLLSGIYFFYVCENGGNHVTLELAVTLFGSLSLFFVGRSLGWSLFFAAMSMASKQVGAFFFLPILVLEAERLWIDKRRVLARFLLCAVAPFLAVFLFTGATPSEIYLGVFRRLASYTVDSAPNPFFFLVEWRRSKFTVLLSLITILVGLVLLGSKNTNYRRWFHVSWVGLLFFLLIRMVRDYPHYNMNMWPLYVVILALGGVQLRQSTRPWLFPAFQVSLLLLCFAPFYPLREWEKRYPIAMLDDFFSPIAKKLQELPSDKVLSIGEEPIMEFLSEKESQDLFAEWAWPYSKYPLNGNPVVVVDRGQRPEEFRDLRVRLEKEGYRQIYRVSVMGLYGIVNVGEIYTR